MKQNPTMSAPRKKYNFAAFDDAYRAAFYRTLAAHPVYATPDQKLIATLDLQQCWLNAAEEVERRTGAVTLVGAGVSLVSAFALRDALVPFSLALTGVLGFAAAGSVSMLRMAEHIRPQAAVMNAHPDPDAAESAAVYKKACQRADRHLSDLRNPQIAING